MKLPSRLIPGLTPDEVKQLESELKYSVLCKQLRKYLNQEISSLEVKEEQLSSFNLGDLAVQVGGRRELRSVLKLLPEE